MQSRCENKVYEYIFPKFEISHLFLRKEVSVGEEEEDLSQVSKIRVDCLTSTLFIMKIYWEELSDPRVPLILGRPFLRTARALIDVHGEEMILRDGNERLILNMRNDTSSYSNEPHQESINMIDVYNVSHKEILKIFNDDIFDPEEDIIENLLNLDKTKDLPPYHDNPLSGNPTPILEPETNDSFPPGNSNPSSPLSHFHNSLSGSTTSSSPSLQNSETSDYFLQEFADELTHIIFSPGNDDLPFDAESDL
ncbi:hypothetical protein Tco_1066432 [Tanacetum coccineum]|uniref:Reverse transcriptase domain-containing protein n=1 Tax=Tanacetum coccineum TaxID=301880 RepID=A0ABQ5HAJ1_9ASTR